MGNADLYANNGSGVSDNGDRNGEVMDLDGEEETDGDLEDKEEESEDEELGEHSNIIH